MKGDIFIRNLLIIIVILLALNIILPLLSNPATSYAAKNIEYKVFLLNDEVPGGEGDKEGKESFEKFLNENGKEGWEFISMTFGSPFVIFKR